MLMNRESVLEMKEAGVQRINLSIDGADGKTHDSFRQVVGAFDAVINAAKVAREVGLPFQVNTTITKLNYKQIDKMLQLAIDLGAVSYHPFLLVPMGRGSDLAEYEIDPEEYEEILTWIYEKSRETPIQFKPTCAPHYYRIFRQKEKEAGRQVTVETHGFDAMTKGCLGGQSFAFISNIGTVQICGFLDEEAGDIRREGYDFKKIWETSGLFSKMRDLDGYGGKCGICEYRKVCGGCRARAFATTGGCLDEEPYCVYVPMRVEQGDEASPSHGIGNSPLPSG
jgi:radical SAM protein with 4Fe4S-binding SPASM domain